jgi:hypothetical protein
LARYNIIYESEESITGQLPRTKEWIEYRGELKIRNGGKKPVSIDMTFVPPHPFAFEMPETYSIRAESVTDAYVKVIRFLERNGVVLRR